MENRSNTGGPPIVTVSQVNRVVSSIVKGDSRLGNVAVRGEISNFTRHAATGHLYFTLKDEHTRLRAVMFADKAAGVKFSPKSGDSVIVRGAIKVYEVNGEYQVYCAEMTRDGEGEQAAAFEELYKRLKAEGLFAQKRPMPARPSEIAVVTASGGAALQDIINVISRRYPIAKLTVVPVTVQGVYAPHSVARGIAAAQHTGAELIIFGRGGGSAEDLSAYNTEEVVRAVYASGIPTISAVGHEIDTTLADLAADLRAPTPSAAAELAVPDISELSAELESVRRYIGSCVTRRIADRERALNSAAGLIKALSPQSRIADGERRLSSLSDSISLKIHNSVERAERAFLCSAEVISALNPLGVLARGYSVTYCGEKIVRAADELKEGDDITLKLARGSASAKVVSVSED